MSEINPKIFRDIEITCDDFHECDEKNKNGCEFISLLFDLLNEKGISTNSEEIGCKPVGDCFAWNIKNKKRL